MVECTVRVVESKEKDLSNYTLIEGFPGMGLVGTIAAKYLIDRLKLKEHGFIDSEIFIPIIRIHDGIPVNPSRIYVDNERKLVVLISEQIIPRVYICKFANVVVDWILEKNISRLISLEGIHTDAKQTARSTIYGIAANEKSKRLLKEYNLNIIGDGITTGITSLILLGLRDSNVEAISVLGDVKRAADYKAAAGLIEKLNDVLGLSIDVKPLLKEAKETEKQLMKHLQKMGEANKAVSKFEGKTPMYT